MNSEIKKRILFFSLLFFSSIFGPQYIFFSVGVLGMFRFINFYEALFMALLRDSIYGHSVEAFWGLEIYFFMILLPIFFFFNFFRSRFRFFAKEF